MKKLTFLFLIAALSGQILFGQNRIITGIVLDEENKPIAFANICPNNFNDCVLSDSAGKFKFNFSTTSIKQIRISTLGYKTQIVSIKDSIKQPIVIYMLHDNFLDDSQSKVQLRSILLSYSMDGMYGNFKSFTELNPEYITMLNQIDHFLMIKLSGYYNNFYGEIGFGGILSPPSKVVDSLKIETSASHMNIAFGYALPTKNLKFIFTPYFSCDYLSYRLHTSSTENKISLSQYFNSQFYDIRFKQWIAIVASDFDLKLFSIRDKSLEHSIYLSLGLGYYFKFTSHPLIQSSGNDLTSNGLINFDNIFTKIALKYNIKN